MNSSQTSSRKTQHTTITKRDSNSFNTKEPVIFINMVPLNADIPAVDNKYNGTNNIVVIRRKPKIDTIKD